MPSTLIIAEEQILTFESSSSANRDDRHELQKRRQRRIQFGNEKSSKLPLQKLKRKASQRMSKRRKRIS
jgi:hypothetical protein